MTVTPNYCLKIHFPDRVLFLSMHFLSSLAVSVHFPAPSNMLTSQSIFPLNEATRRLSPECSSSDSGLRTPAPPRMGGTEHLTRCSTRRANSTLVDQSLLSNRIGDQRSLPTRIGDSIQRLFAVPMLLLPFSLNFTRSSLVSTLIRQIPLVFWAKPSPPSRSLLTHQTRPSRRRADSHCLEPS